MLLGVFASSSPSPLLSLSPHSHPHLSVQVKADVPGVSKEDIHISVEGNVLTLKVQSGGEKKEDKEEEGVKWHRVERHSSFVQRSLRMPANAELDNVHAKYDNGVLFLEVPKKTNGSKDTKRIPVE